jgi:hypothetical protein
MLDLGMGQDRRCTAGRVFHSVAPDRVYSGADGIAEVPNYLGRLGRDRAACQIGAWMLIAASDAAAKTLGLPQDSPDGEASVRRLPESVW